MNKSGDGLAMAGHHLHLYLCISVSEAEAEADAEVEATAAKLFYCLNSLDDNEDASVLRLLVAHSPVSNKCKCKSAQLTLLVLLLCIVL